MAARRPLQGLSSGLLRTCLLSLLVVYCPELKQVEWRLNTAQRAGAGATLEVPAFAGMEVKVWLSFVRADGRKTANSRHLGAVNL